MPRALTVPSVSKKSLDCSRPCATFECSFSYARRVAHWGAPPADLKDLTEELERSDTSKQAALLSHQLGRRAGPCAPLAKRLSATTKQPFEARESYLVASVDQGLRECGCSSWVDIDGFEYLVMRTLRAPARDHFDIALPSAEAGR